MIHLGRHPKCSFNNKISEPIYYVRRFYTTETDYNIHTYHLYVSISWLQSFKFASFLVFIVTIEYNILQLYDTLHI